MGRLESVDGRLPRRAQDLAHSRAILERLTQENPEEPRYQSSLADCYSEIGIALAKLESPTKAWPSMKKPGRSSKRLIDRYPDNLAYKKGFAENLNRDRFRACTSGRTTPLLSRRFTRSKTSARRC